MAGNGLFTTIDPESRRVVPDVRGRVKVKVVYVVLEAQYQAALSKAVNNINSTNTKVEGEREQCAGGLVPVAAAPRSVAVVSAWANDLKQC